MGFDWPSASVRLARTAEAIQIIRKLWERPKKEKENQGSGFVNFEGQYFRVRGARLYTPPSSERIPLYMAASGEEAIQTAAKYTVQHQNLITQKKRLIYLIELQLTREGIQTHWKK